MFKKGDTVVTKRPFWYHGEDLGGMPGVVEDTPGHVMVHIAGYHSNPVRCFSREIELAVPEQEEENPWDIPTKEYNLGDLFPDWTDGDA